MGSASDQNAKAEPFQQRCFKVFERTLGAEHPSTLIFLGEWATTLGKLGRYGEAAELLLQGLQASERTLGKEHPDTLQDLANYATILYSMGRKSEAQQHFLRCVEASERALGKTHPDTVQRAEWVAKL